MFKSLVKRYKVILIVTLIIAWAGFNQYQLSELRGNLNRVQSVLGSSALSSRLLIWRDKPDTLFQHIYDLERSVDDSVANLKGMLGDIESQLYNIGLKLGVR